MKQIKQYRKPKLKRILFQPKLKHTILLNGARGINPIASGKQ